LWVEKNPLMRLRPLECWPNKPFIRIL
jgi:hypothetical protein